MNNGEVRIPVPARMVSILVDEVGRLSVSGEECRLRTRVSVAVRALSCTLNRLLNRNPYSDTLKRPAYATPLAVTTPRMRTEQEIGDRRQETGGGAMNSGNTDASARAASIRIDEAGRLSVSGEECRLRTRVSVAVRALSCTLNRLLNRNTYSDTLTRPAYATPLAVATGTIWMRRSE
jgi:hypothetical protein